MIGRITGIGLAQHAITAGWVYLHTMVGVLIFPPITAASTQEFKHMVLSNEQLQVQSMVNLQLSVKAFTVPQ